MTLIKRSIDCSEEAKDGGNENENIARIANAVQVTLLSVSVSVSVSLSASVSVLHIPTSLLLTV